MLPARVLSAASSPPQAEVLPLRQYVKAALPVVSNPASLLYLRKGQEEFQGFFFSKINRTLDLFHRKKKKKEQALFLVGTGLEPGEEGAADEGGKGDQKQPSLLTKEFLPPQSSEGHHRD